RVVAEALNRDFPGNPVSPIEVVARLRGPAVAPEQRAALASYVRHLDGVPGVIAAQATGVRGEIARIDLRYAAEPASVTARQIVTAVRAIPAPAGGRGDVGGVTAGLGDEPASPPPTLPRVARVVCPGTVALLFPAVSS